MCTKGWGLGKGEWHLTFFNFTSIGDITLKCFEGPFSRFAIFCEIDTLQSFSFYSVFHFFSVPFGARIVLAGFTKFSVLL